MSHPLRDAYASVLAKNESSPAYAEVIWLIETLEKEHILKDTLLEEVTHFSDDEAKALIRMSGNEQTLRRNLERRAKDLLEAIKNGTSTTQSPPHPDRYDAPDPQEESYSKQDSAPTREPSKKAYPSSPPEHGPDEDVRIIKNRIKPHEPPSGVTTLHPNDHKRLPSGYTITSLPDLISHLTSDPDAYSHKEEIVAWIGTTLKEDTSELSSAPDKAAFIRTLTAIMSKRIDTVMQKTRERLMRIETRPHHVDETFTKLRKTLETAETDNGLDLPSIPESLKKTDVFEKDAKRAEKDLSKRTSDKHPDAQEDPMTDYDRIRALEEALERREALVREREKEIEEKLYSIEEKHYQTFDQSVIADYEKQIAELKSQIEERNRPEEPAPQEEQTPDSYVAQEVAQIAQIQAKTPHEAAIDTRLIAMQHAVNDKRYVEAIKELHEAKRIIKEKMTHEGKKDKLIDKMTEYEISALEMDIKIMMLKQ